MARNHRAFSPTCAAVLLGALRTMLCAWSSQYPHRLLTSLFLFQLPNPLLQELPLWFLLGQRQSFLIRGPSLWGETGDRQDVHQFHSSKNWGRPPHKKSKAGQPPSGRENGK